MDKARKRLLIIALALMTFLVANAQFSIGIRESRYAYGSYRFQSGVRFSAEHSLYSEPMGYQRIGFSVGYDRALPYGFNWVVKAFGATTWNRSYQVVAGEVSINYHYRWLGLYATINPRYDSGLKYMTCWEAGASVNIIQPITFVADYTTIPQYRVSEKRINAGLEFKVQSLSVTPKLSFSVDNNTAFKNMRVLISMNYDF